MAIRHQYLKPFHSYNFNDHARMIDSDCLCYLIILCLLYHLEIDLIDSNVAMTNIVATKSWAEIIEAKGTDIVATEAVL